MSKTRKMMYSVVGLALTATSVLFSASSASAASDVPDSKFRNAKSQKCVAIPSNSEANGTAAIQWTCSNNTDQIWYADWVPGGNGDRWRLINHYSGKCLAIGGGSSAVGAKAVQWECSGNDDQVWVYDSIGRLRNVDTGLCLAVPGSSESNGTELVQWTCTTNTDQRWEWGVPV